jgi:ABC-type cobalamin/Fe3+-siderophores transport system ATPase subunit
MTFNLNIPQSDDTSLNVSINMGESLFVLGANGTGKSSLMHLFYTSNTSNSRRLSAHRQTWFESNALTMTAAGRRQVDTNMRNTDTNPRARWLDNYSSERSNMAIYDLIDAENVRARGIADAVDSNQIDLAQILSKKDAPIKIINELFCLSNIPIEIFVEEREQVVAKKSGSTPYSIAELSDGERNALLIAANVLTVPENTLLLIDEPERHLHRSIISPFLTLLFAKRPDCAFIVSTHDITLPLDNPSACTLLVRGCTYNNSSVTAWEVNIIPEATQITDDLKKDILGARRKLLFIEGTEQSLDKPLYSLIFPNVSIIAKQSCRDVEHAVSGIRDANDLHWLSAFGIVDNDRRTQPDIDRLKEKGIYAISVFSVESIYYHPEIQLMVTKLHAGVTGGDVPTRLINAKNEAFTAITPHIKRLSERSAERAIREKIFTYLPTSKTIADGTPIEIKVDVSVLVREEFERLQNALNTGDIALIIGRYPIRETPALDKIAKTLGFQDRQQYEDAVRKLIMDDNKALKFVKSLFSNLDADINVI